MRIINKTFELPDGRKVSIETGKLAKQADGSVVVRMGNTMLLATVVAREEAAEGVDFLPLSVDYLEKFASSGKIPGGFLKRESRPTEFEILVSRLVDRALRPLFPDDYHCEIQVIIYLISADSESLPDALAALAASAAFAVSDIPFQGPISEVRVAKVGPDYIINPTPKQLEQSELDMIVAASAKEILMVEGELNEVSEEVMLEAIKVAHDAIKLQCAVQEELAAEVGITQKRAYKGDEENEELKQKIWGEVYDKMYAAAATMTANKKLRGENFKKVKEEFLASLPEDHGYSGSMISRYLKQVEKKACRDLVLNTGKRLDGRSTEEIRPIWCEVDYLPSPHGSSIFTRGETQSLTTVTLGTKLDEQIIDGAMRSGSNKFMLHYNFPPFSTGEVKPNRGPGRREIGHGNLALRALSKALPPENENPYTIRVVSDILESNGSSSMATVCAGSLALMDAGIKVKGPVSGIAMGMISDSSTGRYAVLSDILGDEDHLGDMDFKVTGTANGITACQMDIKVDGLSYEVLYEALQQAKRGRLHILGEMAKVITEPRADYKPHAPRSVTIEIDKDQIGAVIGPGGKVVQEIQRVTKTTVIIEEVEKCGLVNIFAVDKESMDKAYQWVKSIVAQPEVNEVYTGIVKSIQPFGAFVEFMKGREGLLHISEISWQRLESMDGVLEEGEEIKVKLIEVDKKTGKFRLSRKVLIPKPDNLPQQPPRSQSGGSSEGGNGGGGGGRPPFKKFGNKPRQ